MGLELPSARQWTLTRRSLGRLRSRARSMRANRLQGMGARRRLVVMKANCARRRLGREAAPAVWLATRRRRPPGRCSYPCATERRPVGRFPRLGQVELRLGPAWVRYRGTATPETDPPSTFHRPVLIPGRHRARSSRPRVTLLRYRPSPWWLPAAMPTSPTYRALVPRSLPDPWFSFVASARVRPGACRGTRQCALHRPAVLHRVAD